MSSLERYSLLVILAVTYVVTLGVLLWQRKADNFHVATAYVAAPPIAQPAPRLMPARPVQAEASSEAHSPVSAPVRAAPTPNDSPMNSDGPDLPVTLYVVPTTVSIKEEGPDGVTRRVNKSVNEAIISNESEQVLTITAVDVNPSTGESTQAEFVLGLNGQKHLNIDDGVTLSAGDELSLRSPFFRDRTQSIP